MVQKLQFFPFYVCWLEHDYMEMKVIVRDQSKNYFHLIPKIGPLWGGGGV